MSQALKNYRLDQLKKQEEELVKAAEGYEASSESENVEVRQNDSDPTQSTPENLMEPSNSEPEVTAEQDAKVNDTEQDLSFWKNRALDAEYRFGKYKAKTDTTIYKLRVESKELREEILKLNDTISNLRKLETAKGTDEVFTPAVVDVLGEEAVEAIKKVIEKTNERVDIAERKLQEQTVRGVESKIKEDEMSAYESFVEALTEFVPDCIAMNRDQGFLDWLDQPDSTGVKRLNRLQAAQRIGDVERVASFFNDYKKLTATPKAVRKDSIINRTGPVQKSSSTETQKQPTVEPVTVSFMKQFEADVSRGKYKGRESEKAAIDKRIETAYLTGNIINK